MNSRPMSNIDKQARASNEGIKTYFIHPMVFGSTDPGHGHVPVVKAEDFEKLRAKLEVAEKRVAELEARDKPKFVQCWSCKHDIEILAIADCDGYCPRCAAPIDLDDEPYAAAGKGE